MPENCDEPTPSKHMKLLPDKNQNVIITNKRSRNAERSIEDVIRNQKKRASKRVALTLLPVVILIGIILIFWIINTMNDAIEDTKTAESKELSTSESNELKRKRQFVRNMTLDAWNVYRKYAWGHDAVRPVSREPYDEWIGSGLNIVAAMSTLHVMGLQKEFNQGKQWIVNELDFATIDQNVDVYLSITQFVGSLLSCYVLTGDEVFKRKAEKIAHIIEPAFKSSTGLPYVYLNPSKRSASKSTNYLSQIVHQQPELIFLSNINNDVRIKVQLQKIKKFMSSIVKPKSLLMSEIDVNSGQWVSSKSTLSGNANEFYYNLVRSYIQSGGRDLKAMQMYSDTFQKIVDNGLFRSSKNGFVFVGEYDIDSKQHSQLLFSSACNLGAMIALAAKEIEKLKMVEKSQSDYQWQLAVNLTKTYHKAANNTNTKLLPSYLVFTKSSKDAFISSAKSSKLAESYFILWRLTHDVKYRHYAWQLAQAIHQHTRTVTGGYASIENVNAISTVFNKNDIQFPYFFSETLKYLYLIFTDDTVLPLDQWVFNTFGHPLPVCGKHKLYPEKIVNKFESLTV